MMKSEMQRFREVMAANGYEVVRIEYHYYNDLGYIEVDDPDGVTVMGRPSKLEDIRGWEECRVTLIDVREQDPEVRQVYVEPWLMAHNLEMWEACGFRSDEETTAKISEWIKDHPAPSRNDRLALYRVEVAK